MGPAVTVGWAPTVDPGILEREIEPLRNYLEQSLKRRVVFRINGSYAEAGQELREGQLDFAVLPPLLLVKTRKLASGVHPVAVKEYDGVVDSDGLLIVRSDSQVRRLEELRDRVFCSPDPNSTTGYFLPRAHLRNNGIDPDNFFRKIHWSGDHLQAIRDLLAGVCDAAATYSGAFISSDDLDIPVAQLRTLAITGHTTMDTVCAGPDVPESLVTDMQNALLTFDPRQLSDVQSSELKITPDEAWLGASQRITGFAPVNPDVFDDLTREVANAQKQVTDLHDAGKASDP